MTESALDIDHPNSGPVKRYECSIQLCVRLWVWRADVCACHRAVFIYSSAVQHVNIIMRGACKCMYGAGEYPRVINVSKNSSN